MTNRADDGAERREERDGCAATAPRRLAWLAAAQKDLCCYCGCETWLSPRRGQEARLRARWGMPASRSLACQLAFDYRMATVEHVRPRSQGGTDAPANLTMACAYCNSTRHDRSPELHRHAMESLKRAGRHPCFPDANAEARR